MLSPKSNYKATRGGGESHHFSTMGNQSKTEQTEKSLFMKMTALRGKNRLSL